MEILGSDLTRNDSYSTIASSAAATHLQQMKKLQQSREIQQSANLTLSANQTAIIVEHNGSITYNYTHPFDLNRQSDVDSTRKNSQNSSSIGDLTKTDKVLRGTSKRKIVLIIVPVISIIVLISIILPVMLIVDFNDNDEIPTAPSNSFRLVTRDEWGASSSSADIPRLLLPIKRIIVAHTGGVSCADNCKEQVQIIQAENSHLDDIPFNFLIGGDDNARVYEGRGFELEGQHTRSKDATEYNSIGICIAFIGNYETVPPSANQLNVLNDFIEHFVFNGKIDDSYIVVTQDDLIHSNTSSGALNDAISSFPNFYSLQKVYRRDDWHAQKKSRYRKFNRTMDLVMLTHTVSEFCSSVIDCGVIISEMQEAALIEDYEDIQFNFIIGGDGLVFEGRGWDFIAEHFYGMNAFTVGIGFIGNFNNTEPSQGMLDAILKLMDEGEALGKLTSDYRVNGRQDYGLAGPGDDFMKHVREWCRYGNRTRPC